MAQTDLDSDTIKQRLKEALAETLHEERDFLHDIFTEVIEDFALSESIREGLKTKRASRDDVLGVLRGKE